MYFSGARSTAVLSTRTYQSDSFKIQSSSVTICFAGNIAELKKYSTPNRCNYGPCIQSVGLKTILHRPPSEISLVTWSAARHRTVHFSFGNRNVELPEKKHQPGYTKCVYVHWKCPWPLIRLVPCRKSKNAVNRIEIENVGRVTENVKCFIESKNGWEWFKYIRNWPWNAEYIWYTSDAPNNWNPNSNKSSTGHWVFFCENSIIRKNPTRSRWSEYSLRCESGFRIF